LQNGAPDGLALIDDAGNVIQFLSYEGTITAVGGQADGLTSEDIGEEESGSTPVGESLQLAGTGTDYENFAWANPSLASFGQVNTNQSFNGSLSSNSFSDLSFNLYPNPVSNGILHIETSASDALDIEFFNMLGQRVLTSKNSKSINVSNLNAGVYLVKLNQGSFYVTKKIVIK